MPKSKDDEGISSKIIWIIGGAALSAFAVYHVNEYIKGREECQQLRYEKQRRLEEKKEGE